LYWDSNAGSKSAGVFFGCFIRLGAGTTAEWLKRCINEEMQQFSWCRIH